MKYLILIALLALFISCTNYLSYDNWDVEIDGKLYKNCSIKVREGGTCQLILYNEKASYSFKTDAIKSITMRRK